MAQTAWCTPLAHSIVVLLVLALAASANGSLDHLLPMINKLQDVMAVMPERSTGIELPQIVVVGSQSSGKSSVLESVVGRDFLPRGSGIVTRAPLILQLQHLTEEKAKTVGCNEYGEFLHCPQKRFTEFAKIRTEIEEETQRIVGNGKKQAITHTPIRLRITSTKVPNLTLVDLPGMTKVPVGDQPKNIEVQIRDLVLQYVANPSSIILAVTPANSDLATSESLQLAKAVDPKGDRTVGVLTKIDLMDKGTNAKEMLGGKVVPLKLGYIGVVNRSQKDIVDQKDMESARDAEERFFSEHPAYSQLSQRGLIGTRYLARRLNTILVHHIKARLPALKARVSSMVERTRKELQALGEAPSDDQDDQRKLLISIITQYVDNFCTTIDGGRHLTSFSELRGGAKISHTFNQLYPQHLAAIDPHANIKASEIYTTIRNTKGARSALYGSIPQDAFEMLVKRLIKQLREPSAWCVDTIAEELRIISEQCEPTDLGRFDALRGRFRTVVAELLQRCYRDAKKMMESLIAFELAYINTSHPDFADVGEVLARTFTKEDAGPPSHPPAPVRPRAVPAGQEGAGDPVGVSADALNLHLGGVGGWFGGKDGKAGRAAPAPAPVGRGPAGMQAPGMAGGGEAAARRGARPHLEWIREGLAAQGLQLDRREEGEMELVFTFVLSYFDIVRKNLRDSLPKATMHLMVNQAKEKIQVELLRHLYREELMAEVFNERADVREQREGCRKMLNVLNRATGVLNEVSALDT